MTGKRAFCTICSLNHSFSRKYAYVPTSHLQSQVRHRNRSTDQQQVPHIPVMSSEIVQLIQPQNGKRYLDMTFGAGGHTYALFKECSDIQVVGLDQDIDALKLRHQPELKQQYPESQLTTLHGRFSDLPSLLREHDIQAGFDGVIFDIGFSSMQMNDKRRGFTLSKNAWLDMRMDQRNMKVTAADVINRCEQADLKKIFKKYGEEKLSRQIAQKIVEARQMLGEIMTTRQLQDLVREVYTENGVEVQQDKLGRSRHPATLIFQALRIFVNDELNQLYAGLQVAYNVLKTNSPCVVLTFQSLEQKIVLQSLNYEHASVREKLVTSDLKENHRQWRDYCEYLPSDSEIEMNPRCRSAQLHIAYK